jgi:hypothetical protein
MHIMNKRVPSMPQVFGSGTAATTEILEIIKYLP